MSKIDDYKLAIINHDLVNYRGDIHGKDYHEEVMMNYGIERYGRNFFWCF